MLEKLQTETGMQRRAFYYGGGKGRSSDAVLATSCGVAWFQVSFAGGVYWEGDQVIREDVLVFKCRRAIYGLREIGV